MENDKPAFAIGHNEPPLSEILAQKYETLREEIRCLPSDAGGLPAPINDDSDAAAISDFIKRASAHNKQIEAFRKVEKDPVLKAGNTIDAFLRAEANAVAKVVQPLERALTKYLQDKAEAERQERLRRARELEAQERAAREAAAAALREAQEAEEAGLRAAQAESAALASRAMHEATLANVAGVRAAKAVEAAPAEMGRTRGSESLATLQRAWEFEILDFDQIDIQRLWPFVSRPAVEAALRAFVAAGNREMPGVRIFETTTARVR